MKAIHQLATFQNIIAQYPSDQPLSRFLAAFYRQNKQMGSKDRRIASRLLYNYFRLGNILKEESPQQRLIVAEFLVNNQPNSFLNHFKPEWDELVHLPLTEKIKIVEEQFPAFHLADVFPFSDHLTSVLDPPAFYLSFFIQPDLYIRIKRGQEKGIINLVTDAGINFKIINQQTLAFPNGTKLDQLIADKGIYEVQDISSQKVGTYFKPNKWDKWWDCCAASGGKSLLLHDEQPDIKLLVTDNRESILENLKERFALAGIRNYQLKILDLTLNQDQYLHDYVFDGIIYDAPCSGSGTWGRTPEMIAQFADHKIKFFTELQRKIAINVVKHLKPGKPIIYITCSVFKEENEEQVAWLVKTFDLEVESQELIKGYQAKADTMFVARLLKR
ncbi:RsmB/NOP family class I SAM-dependent RNA methyltransferase [Pedobacter cryophilus]|uniref:RsmB/NOP family class I SAM-dependent RNA methyltransferase n=1 Tax=Pedobacter cryophilus TaxID=2571271 RepID=A0A4U1C178_9SPHI|nr:RsmB/NOP family class I SAM-dependent RNA methyltransferase [Pedobacter cryophilus]TKB98971.1 RsmB/NOP family class I SAM-dependent RNA methyltransferase [Pedobacter cryophilus]